MSLTLLKNTEAQINVVRLAANASGPKGAQTKNWTQFRYASVITRLYALYEHFVKQLLVDWLDALPNLVDKYSELDARIKREHAMGVGLILTQIGRRRFRHLKDKQDIMVGQLYRGMVEDRPYTLVADAFTHHENNLRRELLDELFRKVGIDDLWKWVDGHRRVRSAAANLGQTAESALDEFVQLRNDASHGDTANTLGPSELDGFVELMSSICQALVERVYFSRLSFDLKAGRRIRIGYISEYFARPKAAIAICLGTKLFKQGAAVLLSGRSYCHPAHIESLQINGRNFDAIVGCAGTELGMKFDVSAEHDLSIYV